MDMRFKSLKLLGRVATSLNMSKPCEKRIEFISNRVMLVIPCA